MGDAARPDLSISIPTRNGRDYVRGCVESIQAGTHKISYEIIVVDNASTDGTREMLRAEFPAVRIVGNDVPRGYGASHNDGFVASRGRYFLAMNNDMTVRDGALDAMVERIERGDNVGLLGCRLLNPDGTMQVSCGRDSSVLRMIADDLLPARVPAERIGLREWMREWSHDAERDVKVVQGSCMLIARETFERAGRFDESFNFFREEFDLCRRVRAMGMRVLFFPGAEIVHYGGQTFKTVRLSAYQTFFETRYKYFVKYHGKAAALVVTASAFAGVVMRFAVCSVLRLVRGPAVAERVQLYREMTPWFFGAARPWRPR